MQRPGHNRILWLAFLGFALRAVIPAGYMPAAIADGLPFVACPDGLYGQPFIAAVGAGHAHEQNHDGHDSDNRPSDGGGHDSVARDFCAFGVLLGASVLATDSGPVSLSAPQYEPPPISPDAIVQSSTARTNRARAPPKVSTIDA